MKERIIGNGGVKTRSFGMHDAVADGELMRDVPTRLVFVKDATERDTLEGLLPGTFVATYGCGNVWQLNGDGEWETIK